MLYAICPRTYFPLRDGDRRSTPTVPSRARRSTWKGITQVGVVPSLVRKESIMDHADAYTHPLPARRIDMRVNDQSFDNDPPEGWEEIKEGHIVVG